MTFFQNANGELFVLDEETGDTYQYFPDEGVGLGELSGFWSKIGNAFKKAGKWIGKNIVPIGATLLTTYTLNQGLRQQPVEPVQTQPTAQPPADGVSGLSSTTILIFGMLAVLLLTRR